MKFSRSRKMMNWNGVHISLLLLVEVFYMSTSADANGNNFEFVKVRLKTLMKNAKGIQRNYKDCFISDNYTAYINTSIPLLKPANCSHVCPHPNATRAEDLDFLSRVKAIFDHMISEEDSNPVTVVQKSKRSTSELMKECRKAAEAALTRLGPRPSCDCGLPRTHNWTTALEPNGTLTSLPDNSLHQRLTREYIILRDIINGVKGILSHNGKAKAPGKEREKPRGRGKNTKTPRKQKKKEERQDKKGRKTTKRRTQSF